MRYRSKRRVRLWSLQLINLHLPVSTSLDHQIDLPPFFSLAFEIEPGMGAATLFTQQRGADR